MPHTIKSENSAQAPFVPFDGALAFLKAHPDCFIFPIRTGRKEPSFANELELASNEPFQLETWARRWPNANWGVALARSGLIVVDVDCKAGKKGPQTLDTLQIFNGQLPPTFTVQSPSGGLHLYFNVANGVTHRALLGEHGFGPGIDSTNYVLLPGSILKTGGVYEIIDDRPIADAPSWFAEYLRPRAPSEAADQIPAVELDQPAFIADAIHYLTHDAPPCIEGKNGERTLLLVYGTLKDMGVSIETAIELVEKHYNKDRDPAHPERPYCEPMWRCGDGPLEDRHDVKARNAWKYLTQNAPGALTAEAEFADEPPETPEPAAKAKEPGEPETAESLIAGWCYVGQQKRFVRKRDGMLWDVEAFNAFFSAVPFPDKPTTTPPAKWVLSRRPGSRYAIQKFDTFCYLPGRPESAGAAYNLYAPSSIVPKEGDTSIWDEHLAYLFPDKTIRGHVLDWLAWVLQNLDKKPKHALFIRGEIHGTGKSWIGDVFAALIGEHNRAPVDQATFETPHNGWQLRTKLVTCEEVRGLSQSTMRRLHGWITQPRLQINEKNMPQVTIPDVLAYIFYSNKRDALPVDDSDRRILAVATDAKPKDRAYYCRLFGVLRDPAKLAAIMYQLMHRRLGDYTAAGRAPDTEAKAELIEEGASDLQAYMLAHAREAPFCYSLVTLAEVVAAIPREFHPRGGRLYAAVRDILRRRFNGIALNRPIQTGARKSEQARVWAIGADAGKYSTLGWADLSAVYRLEHGAASTRAAASTEADFGDSDGLSDGPSDAHTVGTKTLQ